ncbi:hypothetical protein ACHAW6_000396 [Cyclotella cf. meneghiniana]
MTINQMSVICSSSLYMGPPIDPSAPITKLMGEGSRKYCQTVYTHAKWVKHWSPDQFVDNMQTLLSSGMYNQVSREVYATSAVALFVFLWNMIAGGYTDLVGVQHGPLFASPFVQRVELPLAAFSLVLPSLGLLLVEQLYISFMDLLLIFHTNKSYKRWDEARKYWGLTISHSRDLCRLAMAWYENYSAFNSVELVNAETGKLQLINPAKRSQDLQQISVMTWAFVCSMKCHLSPPCKDEANFQLELQACLSPEQAEAIIMACHHPKRALYDRSVAIENLPMHSLRKKIVNEKLSIFEDTLGGCEHLLSSPIPLVYSHHTACFLSLWLLLLPFALYKPFKDSWNHIGMIFATTIISFCLIAIEEGATQNEEPFTILPMQGFCDKIGGWCNEIVSWAGQGQDEY